MIDFRIDENGKAFFEAKFPTPDVAVKELSLAFFLMVRETCRFYSHCEEDMEELEEELVENILDNYDMIAEQEMEQQEKKKENYLYQILIKALPKEQEEEYRRMEQILRNYGINTKADMELFAENYKEKEIHIDGISDRQLKTIVEEINF